MWLASLSSNLAKKVSFLRRIRTLIEGRGRPIRGTRSLWCLLNLGMRLPISDWNFSSFVARAGVRTAIENNWNLKNTTPSQRVAFPMEKTKCTSCEECFGNILLDWSTRAEIMLQPNSRRHFTYSCVWMDCSAMQMVSILWTGLLWIQHLQFCWCSVWGNLQCKNTASLNLCSFWEIWNGTDIICMCWCTQV